jgi:hypothetical protein
MVQSWSTKRRGPILHTLLGATRVAYFQQLPDNRVLSRRKRGFKSRRGRQSNQGFESGL